MWYAVATLVGTIIGVGIFGLPYAASRAGFFVELLYLCVFALVFTLMHLMYGEIMLRTSEQHRLSGYVGFYFGNAAKKCLEGVTVIGLIGGMLVYVLVGSSFLRIVTAGIFGGSDQYYIIFWVIMSAILLFGLKMIERMEVIMLSFMIGIIALIFTVSVPHIELRYFTHSDPHNFFFPYGITLFALAGTAAIPAVRDILRNKEATMKTAITLGTLIPAALYAVFVFSVVGITGFATSENALTGLNGLLGKPMEFAGALFGVCVVATSYIVFGLYLRDTLWYDFTMPRRAALAIAIGAPLVSVFLYPGSYITIISFLGAICGGIESIFIIVAFMRSKTRGDRVPEYTVSLSSPVLYALITLFAFGIIYTLVFNGRI